MNKLVNRLGELEYYISVYHLYRVVIETTGQEYRRYWIYEGNGRTNKNIII